MNNMEIGATSGLPWFDFKTLNTELDQNFKKHTVSHRAITALCTETDHQLESALTNRTTNSARVTQLSWVGTRPH